MTALGWTGYADGWMISPEGRPAIPLPPLSLDLVHEAEQTMTDKQWARYPIWLAKVIAGTQDKSRAGSTRIYVPQHVLLGATKEQRLEAFLRVKGLWQDRA